MANTFITPSVIARRGLATLYNTIVLAGLVWRDFDADFSGKVGDTITIRKPAVFTAEEFNRSAGITLQNATEGSTDLTLDKIPNVSFPVTDEQMTLEISDFQGQLLSPAMEAIAQKIDGDLAEALADAATQVAAATGSTAANVAFAKARELLTRAKLPLTERYAVLSPESVTKALADDLLVAADKSGSTDALRNAIVGRIFNFETYETQSFGLGPNDRGQADGVAFHRSAVTLAARPLDAPKGLAGSQVAVENYRGLSLRVVYAYNNTYKQDEVSVDSLYGVAATRPEGAVELNFGQGS